MRGGGCGWFTAFVVDITSCFRMCLLCSGKANSFFPSFATKGTLPNEWAMKVVGFRQFTSIALDIIHISLHTPAVHMARQKPFSCEKNFATGGTSANRNWL